MRWGGGREGGGGAEVGRGKEVLNFDVRSIVSYPVLRP